MKKLIAAVAATALAAGALAIPAFAATKTVQVKDNKFVAKLDHRVQGHDGQVGVEGQGPAQRDRHQGPGEVQVHDPGQGQLLQEADQEGDLHHRCAPSTPPA